MKKHAETIEKQKYYLGNSGIAEDQEVFLPNIGINKQINDILVGDTIYSLLERQIIPQKVTNKVDQGMKVVYEINNKIQLTDDHPILTTNGYTEVRNLKEGRYFNKKRVLSKVR